MVARRRPARALLAVESALVLTDPRLPGLASGGRVDPTPGRLSALADRGPRGADAGSRGGGEASLKSSGGTATKGRSSQGLASPLPDTVDASIVTGPEPGVATPFALGPAVARSGDCMPGPAGVGEDEVAADGVACAADAVAGLGRDGERPSLSSPLPAMGLAGSALAGPADTGPAVLGRDWAEAFTGSPSHTVAGRPWRALGASTGLLAVPAWGWGDAVAIRLTSAGVRSVVSSHSDPEGSRRHTCRPLRTPKDRQKWYKNPQLDASSPS